MSDGFSIYNRGVPLAPDVTLLLSEYRDMPDGMEITHESLELLIGQCKNSRRYKTVIHAWRRFIFRDKNILLASIRGVGYRVANPHQRVCVAIGKIKTGMKHIKRASTIMLQTDHALLDGEDLRLYQHHKTLYGRLRLAELTAPDV